MQKSYDAANKLFKRYPSPYARKKANYSLADSQRDMKEIFEPLKKLQWHTKGGVLQESKPKFTKSFLAPVWLTAWNNVLPDYYKSKKMSELVFENEGTLQEESHFTQPQCFTDIDQNCWTDRLMSSLRSIRTCQFSENPSKLCNVRLTFVSGKVDEATETMEFCKNGETNCCGKEAICTEHAFDERMAITRM